MVISSPMNFLKVKKLFSKNTVEKYGIIFILIFFIGTVVTGIFFNHSIPNTIGDETVLMASTLNMIAEPSLRPDYPTMYHMPFATYIYLPFFVVLLVFLRISGLFTSLEELKSFGIVHYAELLPMARFISVLLGAASIYLVYKICDKLFNNKFISLTASFLLSTNLMFVYLAHFGKVWLPQIFVILLTFYFIIGIYQKTQPQFRDYFKVALLTGISFGTHFIGILIYFPFLTVHYLRNKNRKLREIFITNKLFWLSNLIVVILLPFIYYLNPYGFINYTQRSSRAATSILNESISLGDTHANFWQGFSGYGQVLFEYGPLLTILFLLGLVPLFLQKRNLFFIFGSFILGYYFVIGPVIGSTHFEPRFISPIIPFMAIISAYGIYYFYKSNFVGKKIKIILLFILFSSFLYSPILLDYKLIQPSSMISAQKWIYNNLSQESKIINFYNYLPINENRETIEDTKQYNTYFFTRKREYLLSIDDADYPKPNYYVLIPPNYRGRGDIPEEILNREFDYALIAWWHKDDYVSALKVAQPFGVKEENLVKIFPPGATPDSFSMNTENMRNPFRNLRKLNHIGPIIAIYKLN